MNRLSATILAATLIVCGQAIAAPPNDECSSPNPISGVGQWSLDDLLTATLSTSPPATIPIVTRDVWYCWTPTWTGVAEISLDPITLANGSPGPTLLGCEVYAGCGCPNTAAGTGPIASINPAPGTPRTATFQVECGQKYLIRMGGERYPSPPANPLRNFAITKVQGGEDCPPPAVIANNSCCGGKPNYEDPLWTANYTGQVAVATNSPSGWSGQNLGPTITIFNLASTPPAVPGNNWDPVAGGPSTTFRYSKSQWGSDTLGSIFPLTLDAAGNMYTAYCAATNAPGASNLPGSTSGSIFKIPTGTGIPVVFSNIPDNAAPPVISGFVGCSGVLTSPPGIGDVVVDCVHNGQLFASSFADGRIYRISSSGAPIEAFDHATNAVQGPTRELNNNYDKYVPRGERVWAVKPFQGRLYYSVWGQEIGWFLEAACQTSAQLQPNSQPNTIWSVALTPTGAFVPNSRRLELQLPIFPTAYLPAPSDSFYQSAAPVSDIDFGPDSRMILAERQVMSNGVSVGAHKSRGFEFAWNGSSWVPVNDRPNLGSLGLEIADTPPGYPPHTGSAGGCSPDFTTPAAGVIGRSWFTGDYLQLTNAGQYIYGITGLVRATPAYATAVHIDYNGNLNSVGFDKAKVCDVEIPCARAVCGMASTPEILCNYPQSQGYTVNFTVTNASSLPATYILISNPPGVTVSPNVIKLNNPSPPGGTSGPLSFTFTSAAPLTTPPCFHITLVDEMFTTCCSFDWCPPELPKCDCGQILNFTATCVPGQPGKYTLTFNVQNLTNTPVSGFFIVKEPPFVPTQVFSPNFFAIPVLNPGQISATITTTITGMTPGQPFCFKVAFTLCESCCAIRKCFTPPPCSPAVTSQSCTPGETCYANCDGSTTTPVLGPADFACFLARFRAGDACANCDASTTPPILGPSDFACFLEKYRAGCP